MANGILLPFVFLYAHSHQPSADHPGVYQQFLAARGRVAERERGSDDVLAAGLIWATVKVNASQRHGGR
jgi:hypothetical protein